MTLKVAIFDLTDTLVKKDGSVAPNVGDLLRTLRKAGVKVAVAANQSTHSAEAHLRNAGLKVDLVIGDDKVKKRKPSPEYCHLAAAQFGVQTREMIYVGDNDNTDALCAINAGVLYLAAKWANPAPQYGLPVDDPAALRRFAFRFLMSEPRWYWKLDTHDRQHRTVRALGLLPATKENYDLKAVLKHDQQRVVEGIDYRSFLFRRLLTCAYLDGLLERVDTWCWYPTHGGKPKHRSQMEFFDQVTRLFRHNHVPDLLVRHKTAVKSALARWQGLQVSFTNQVQTVHLNPERQKKVAGKNVLVADDFFTQGFSFEWARNLLLAGGAADVTCIAFGRYHDDYQIHTPKKNVSIDPWKPCSLQDKDFVVDIVQGVRDQGALAENTRLLRLKP